VATDWARDTEIAPLTHEVSGRPDAWGFDFRFWWLKSGLRSPALKEVLDRLISQRHSPASQSGGQDEVFMMLGAHEFRLKIEGAMVYDFVECQKQWENPSQNT
jgi:hypothetical protein